MQVLKKVRILHDYDIFLILHLAKILWNVDQFKDMLWGASLASAAYRASKDVCGAVEAARTATRAKYTADIAVQNATRTEREADSTPEERKILQERVSRSQMQALHAAVVEHEAASAKRRSVVSLANDVKYWNTNRKRDLIMACTKVVKEQKYSASQNVKAWTELKEGLLDSLSIFDAGQKVQPVSPTQKTSVVGRNDLSLIQESKINEQGSSHETLKSAAAANAIVSPTLENYFSSSTYQQDDEGLPPELVNEASLASNKNHDAEHSVSSESEALVFSDALSTSAMSHESFHATCSEQHAIICGNTEDEYEDGQRKNEESDDTNDMTESMQSLVDGLLTWGGGGNWDVQDDLDLALPKGMAASLAMEERGILDLA